MKRAIIAASVVAGMIVLCVLAYLFPPGRKNRDSELKTPSEAASQEAMESLQKIVAAGDAKTFDQVLDWPGIIERAIEGLEVPEWAKAGMIRTARNHPRGAHPLSLSIAQAAADDGDFKLLRIRMKAGRRCALFRLLDADGNLNYLEMHLAENAAGRVIVCDLFNYRSGELLSQTVRATAGLGFPKGSPEFADNLDLVREFVAAYNAEDQAQVLKLYKQMPPGLRKEKPFLVGAVQAASAIDDEECLNMLEDLRRFYPNDDVFRLYASNYYCLKGDFAEALASVDRLDQEIGGDPYLHVWRSGIHLKSGNLPEARKAAEKALEAEPQLVHVYWSLIDVALMEKNFDEVLRWHIHVRDQLKFEVGDLAEDPTYVEFVKSPQYQQWLKSQPKK